MMLKATFCATLLSLALILGISPAFAKTAVFEIKGDPSIPKALITRDPVSVWQNYPLLKRIASCESWGTPYKEPRQFLSDGSVLKGVINPTDIGLAQINEPTWGTTAKKLGYDIYTADGNLKMAIYIYDHYGSSPWVYSEGCWNK